jgi:hypothetical protein
MDTSLYKTPSPVTAKRRLSAIQTNAIARPERIVTEQVQRIQREWPELRDERRRRMSIGPSSEFLRSLKEDADGVDSSMGFRELERVETLLPLSVLGLKLMMW